MSSRPIIGLTANLVPATSRSFYDGKPLLVAEGSMVDRVLATGGIPLILPIVADPEILQVYATQIDGLLLTGGADVDPGSYGEEARGWSGQPERDAFESALIDVMRARKAPILGVCRGLQVLNVAMGGSLLHDIVTDRPQCHIHREQERYDGLRHPLTVAPGSWVSDLYGGRTEVDCNSIHHQAINQLGTDLAALAWSDDGLIEAIWAPADRWTRAVQWHPEWDPGAPHVGLFKTFVEACTQ
ncbi:MAG: putative glutamine amidotransferase [Myxococcota bacterium]|jgi:putative glutamine amidotransferase